MLLGFEIILITLCYMTIWYFISLAKRDMSIVDIAWGIGFIVNTLALALLTENISSTQVILLILITLWGIRLSSHIAYRNWGKDEDFRYANWRARWMKKGKAYFLLRSFLQVFILQGFFMLVILSPVILNFKSTETTNIVILSTGIIIWLVGFFFESVGDLQLLMFVQAKKRGEYSKNAIMKYGLWKHTRHPNYFGEICQWWGIFIISLNTPIVLLGLVGPVTITYLLIFISGVPMLEKKYKHNEEYKEYKKRVPSLVPWKLFFK